MTEARAHGVSGLGPGESARVCERSWRTRRFTRQHPNEWSRVVVTSLCMKFEVFDKGSSRRDKSLRLVLAAVLCCVVLWLGEYKQLCLLRDPPALTYRVNVVGHLG